MLITIKVKSLSYVNCICSKLHRDCVCKKLELAGVNTSVVGEVVKAEEQMHIRQAGSERWYLYKTSILKKSTEAISGRIRDELKKWFGAYNALIQKLSMFKAILPFATKKSPI